MNAHAIDKYLSGNQMFPDQLKASKSKKPITFGSIIPENEARKHIGFVYLATINGNIHYIGSKLILHGDDWRTYTTSSSYVNARIREGAVVRWEVLEYVNSSNAIKPIESKWIRRFATKPKVQLLNRVDAQGYSLSASPSGSRRLQALTRHDNT